jgi:hypothetical protein
MNRRDLLSRGLQVRFLLGAQLIGEIIREFRSASRPWARKPSRARAGGWERNGDPKAHEVTTKTMRMLRSSEDEQDDEDATTMKAARRCHECGTGRVVPVAKPEEDAIDGSEERSPCEGRVERLSPVGSQPFLT